MQATQYILTFISSQHNYQVHHRNTEDRQEVNDDYKKDAEEV